MAFWLLSLIFVLIPLLYYCFKLRYRWVLSAPDAAKLIFDKTHGKTQGPQGLPDVLRGVFWMSSNPGQELLASLEDSVFDPVRRAFWQKQGVPYSWSRSANCGGWILWVNYSVVGPLLNVWTRFGFDDDTYKSCRIDIYFCGWIWIPLPYVWTMTDVSPPGKEGTVWDRGGYLVCTPTKTDLIYKLLKVIGPSGEKIQPTYDTMLRTLSTKDRPGEPVDGAVVKAWMQYVAGDTVQAPGQEDMQPLV